MKRRQMSPCGNVERRTLARQFRESTSGVRIWMRVVRGLFAIGWVLLPGWVAMLCAAPATSIPADFDSANKLYEQGKFAEAASAYEKMVRSGPVSAPLYFNLGNSLFKSGHVGEAIAAYRDAGELAPRDPDLRANLQFVRDQVQGSTLLPNVWRRRLERLTANEWTLLASLGLWVWLLLLTVNQLRPGLKPALRTWTWLSGAAMAVLCGCLGGALFAESGQTAIVIVHAAAVRNGPLEESPTVFTVHDGAELSILDRNEHWLQVSVGDHHSGWLERDRVIIAPSPVAPQQLK